MYRKTLGQRRKKGGTSVSKIQSTDSARSWFCVLNSPQSLFDKEMNPEQIVDGLIDRWMNQNPRNTCAVNYEIGDTGNHHCHMVLCNENKIRFSTIQNTFPGIHIEPTKGSKADVESYIKKLGKFEEKAHTIVVPAKFSGVILGADNNKNINQIYDDITVMLNAGMSPEQIMSTGLKYRKQETLIRKAYMAKRHQETPLKRQVDVYYHVGESGDGKSYTYVKLCDEYGKENVYLMTDYKNTGTGGIGTVYLTIIRGTPSMVQLLIIYYIIFGSMNISKLLVAILAFGINSGAYVAEIFRSGIMSIDNGQFEAARSLGLTYRQTMLSVILPQAFKNVLPALANEFIVLLKETSISGYIGLTDLTRGGDIIRSITYDAFLPLLGVAFIYLVLVVILSALVKKLERRLRSNERN